MRPLCARSFWMSTADSASLPVTTGSVIVLPSNVRVASVLLAGEVSADIETSPKTGLPLAGSAYQRRSNCLVYAMRVGMCGHTAAFAAGSELFSEDVRTLPARTHTMGPPEAP